MSKPTMARRPDLFIVGPPRCGTTSLYEYLRGHPEVYMSPRKEPHFFASDLDSGSERDGLYFVRDLDSYLALFRGARGEKRVGEASATYMHSREAARRIHEFEPNAYIVASLRDPVEMIHSMHSQRLAIGAEDVDDLEAALAAESDRRAGKRLPAGAFHTWGLFYRDVARFGEQLERYVHLFGRDRVHVILFNELVADPAVTFRHLLEFLEVDPEYVPTTFHVANPNRRTRSTLLRSALQSPAGHRIARRVLPARAQDAVRTAIRPLHRLNRQPQARPAMSVELRDRLRAELAPDLKRLGELVGRDLVRLWWEQPTTDGTGVPAAP